MVTTSGKNAQADGNLMCDRCTAQVHVSQGQSVPRCPNCGNTDFSAINAILAMEAAAAEGEPAAG